MDFNILVTIADLCARKGIEHVVLSPGSRSAPITLAFLRDGRFQCRIFPDERSAGFIALGLAQSTGKPVILICTSGTATYNFAPAVAEAFFQRVPLLVFTADRPKEWIDQLDGQTIRQTSLFGQHVKRFNEIPQSDLHPDTAWHINRIINEAINHCQELPCGPVHVNFPLREPLYPQTPTSVPEANRIIHEVTGTPGLQEEQWKELEGYLNQYSRVLVVPGQLGYNEALLGVLNNLHGQNPRWAFAGDILSNFHPLPFFCRHADAFLGQLTEPEKEKLQPQLLITFGKSLVAKNLKLFLRKYKPAEHWHIEPAGEVADTFQHLTRIIRTTPEQFFGHLFNARLSDVSRDYADLWKRLEKKAVDLIHTFFQSTTSGEFKVVHDLMTALPSPAHLHLANSMSVRYANHIGLHSGQSGIRVFSNRGTSGIDGCTSTATGHAFGTSIPQILITGDLAFFYDRNAFWHQYSVPNLMVVLLNNHGGIIFNLIDGPSEMPESDDYFVTRQSLNGKALSEEFGLEYKNVSKSTWIEFFTRKGSAKVLEVEGTQLENKTIFKAFRNHLKKGYAT